MTKVLHQLGYRFQWNLASLKDDGAGDGVICAPRYMKPGKVAAMPAGLRSRSIFDPQFFLPNSTKGSLPDYRFFPNVVADGFSTADYDAAAAQESAEKCLRFQQTHGFSHVVFPTRHREATPSDFIRSQRELFVDPFTSAYDRLGIDKPALLQLIINDAMFKDERFLNSILNWVTSIPQIEGVYLIPQNSRSTKQVNDIDYLISVLKFIHNIRSNDMDVVVGYVNTEALILLAAAPTAVTIGGYENLRMFSVRAFDDADETKGRGPVARIYVSRMLQWVTHQYIGAIQRVVDDPDEFFDESGYRVTMFEPTYNWHFTKPEPYKHHFSVFAAQLGRFRNLAIPERIRAIRDKCKEAIDTHAMLRDRGVVLDVDSGGDHIPAWLTALNMFAADIGV